MGLNKCVRRSPNEEFAVVAKNVFRSGYRIADMSRKQYRLSRVKFLPFFVNREPATVLMEACGSAHLGKEIRELGPGFRRSM